MSTVFNTNYRSNLAFLSVVFGSTLAVTAAIAGPGAAPPMRALEVNNRIDGPSPADQAILDEINAARADPRAYAQALRGDLPHFHGALFEPPGGDPLMTNEGASAVQEAIADLERRAPAPPLQPDSAIARAALRLVADEGPSGRVGHVGSDGATLEQRLEAAGVWAMSMEEDIAYGPDDAREVVRELIVDDGVPDRGHRTAIFDPHMTRAGLACGSHATWRWMCVIDFTAEPMRSPGSERAGR